MMKVYCLAALDYTMMQEIFRALEHEEEEEGGISLDIEQNTSLIYCVKRFSIKELLNQDNKLMCETCLTRQVATKEIFVGSYPKCLLVHLKRFRIDPQTY